MKTIALILFAVLSFSGLAHAESTFAVDWQLGMGDAATPVKARMDEFHTLLLYIITAIVVFVLALLIYVMLRFRESANPNPSKTTHNVAIEIIWTVVPVVILIVIATQSFPLLYYSDRVEEPDMTVKVNGRQWYWEYEYPDHGGFVFQSYMLKEEDENKPDNYQRLLSTDAPLVLPIETNIQILVTGKDVIHSFAVPAFGVKIDAIPGALNETWVRIEKPGTYYGQCSELCGKDHAFMPIEIKAVPMEEFQAWAAQAKEEYL